MRLCVSTALLLLSAESWFLAANAFSSTKKVAAASHQQASVQHSIPTTLAANEAETTVSTKEIRRTNQLDAATLASSFEPTRFDPFITNCHVQTIGGYFLRDTPAICVPKGDPQEAWKRIWSGLTSKLFSFGHHGKKQQNNNDFWDTRERIDTTDGDWFHADTKYASKQAQEKALCGASSQRHVILLHGLESNSNSTLSKQMARAFLQSGTADKVTCLNFRSCSVDEAGTSLLNHNLGAYHLGFTDDLKYYLEMIRHRGDEIYLSGFSLGANVALKALGEMGDSAIGVYNIRGAAVASAPLEQETNARALGRPGINRLIYTNELLKSLKQKAVDQWRQFGPPQEDAIVKAAHTWTLQEHEKTVTDRMADTLWDASFVFSCTWQSLAEKDAFQQQKTKIASEWSRLLGRLWSKEVPHNSEAAPVGGNLSNSWPWFKGQNRTHGESSILATTKDVKERWDSFLMDSSKMHRGVAPETAFASAAVGSLMASYITGDVSPEILALGALVSAYTTIHQGPIGDFLRLVGNIAIGTTIVAGEAWEQIVQLKECRRRQTEEMWRTHRESQSLHEPFDLARALSAKTITEFDDAFIAPIYGFNSAWAYYRNTSSSFFLEDIAVPTIIINAEDDPFFDRSVHPIEKTAEAGGRAPVKLVRTKKGGHLGFCFHQTNNVAGETKDATVGWMPQELSRFLQHIQKRQ